MTDPSLYEGFGTRIALRAVNITHAYLACLIEDRGPRHGH